jgi:hypothetical protein
MTTLKPYRELSESEQKEFIFKFVTRCQYHPEFYEFVGNLMEEYEDPFEEQGNIQVIKEEFQNS